MKTLCKIIAEITWEAYCSFKYFIKSNLVTFANILNLILPFAMYFVGQYAVHTRDELTIGYEIFIPLAFIVIIYYLKSTANKIGKGTTVPIPEKRFTEVDDDGEVHIENRRIQELILYMADLEDWMERKGIL